MKLKLPSAKIIGMFLILTMLVSTFAFSILQSSSFNPQQDRLPENRIFDYRLSAQQQNLILSYGGSIITFIYPPDCSYCLEQKNYLENLVKKYKWLYLELIPSKTNITTVIITGPYTQNTLENKSNEEIFSSLCEVAYQPPIECVLR